MSKIQELKAKLAEKIAGWKGKLFKSSSTPKPQEPGIIRKTIHTWKSGTTGTRIQIFVIFLALTVGIYGMLRLSARLIQRKEAIRSLFFKGAERYDKMEDFLKRESEMKRESASIVSIDRIRINATLKDGSPAFLSLNLWVKCDSPRTAKYVEEIYPKLHDAIIVKIQNVNQLDLTTEAGKERLKTSMVQAMNGAMQTGKIEDVHFFNMIFDSPNSPAP